MRMIRIVVLMSVVVSVTVPHAVSQVKPVRSEGRRIQTLRQVLHRRLAELHTADSLREMTVQQAMVAAAAAREFRAPQQWPEDRRWAPRRHFGPLYGNSPDIHLNGGSAAFVYNRFFTGHPDADVFRKYYGQTLPTNQPTDPGAVPGAVPSSGFGDVRLNFDRLTYSSRYGGSFLLTFRSMEDLQVEYRAGASVWDIGSLDMLVYVRPVATLFNPNSPPFQVPDGNVHVEFRPQAVVEYAVSGLIVQGGDPLPALMTALTQAAGTISGGTTGSTFRREATRFSHGLVHAAFWDEIGQTRNVTGIEISEGFFFPRTSASLAVARVLVQVSDINLDTEPGHEEITVTVDAGHMFQNTPTPPSFSWDFPEIDNHGSTYWMTVGVFPLDWDCGQLETVILMVKVREDDLGEFDDRFITDPLAFETGLLDCSGMQTAFNNGQFGLYEQFPDRQLLIMDDDDVEGALTLRMRVDVIKQ